jgi:hypothetical protein
MEPVLVLTLTAIVAAIFWNFVQMRALERRLNSIEKQHLALVADLEDLLYREG